MAIMSRACVRNNTIFSTKTNVKTVLYKVYIYIYI